MTKHILVSKPGKDAKEYTLPDDFYLDSDFSLLKIHDSGPFTTDILGEKTIYHNLGYKPFVLVFSQAIVTDFNTFEWSFTDEYYQHDWYVQGATYVNYGYTKIYDDRIHISLMDTYSGPRPGAINGYYYIFKEKLA